MKKCPMSQDCYIIDVKPVDFLLSTIIVFIYNQDGVMAMGSTHRYRKKYVTTLMYKPV